MLNRLAGTAVAVALLAISSSASASSSDAWAAFDAKVTKACTSASGIRNPGASMIVGFDDRVGVAAMLIWDKSRGSTASKLCLFDKRAGRAFISDAEMWSAPPQPVAQETRPMDEVPKMVRTRKGDRNYYFANGCSVIVDRRRAIILFVDGPCKSFHEDIALLYASGD